MAILTSKDNKNSLLKVYCSSGILFTEIGTRYYRVQPTEGKQAKLFRISKLDIEAAVNLHCYLDLEVDDLIESLLEAEEILNNLPVVCDCDVTVHSSIAKALLGCARMLQTGEPGESLQVFYNRIREEMNVRKPKD